MNFNAWYRKAAFAAAVFIVICLPAIFWACEHFFDLSFSKSAQETWGRIFSNFDESSGGGDDDGGD